jgi:hypothetical protein
MWRQQKDGSWVDPYGRTWEYKNGTLNIYDPGGNLIPPGDPNYGDIEGSLPPQVQQQLLSGDSQTPPTGAPMTVNAGVQTPPAVAPTAQPAINAPPTATGANAMQQYAQFGGPPQITPPPSPAPTPTPLSAQLMPGSAGYTPPPWPQWNPFSGVPGAASAVGGALSAVGGAVDTAENAMGDVLQGGVTGLFSGLQEIMGGGTGDVTRQNYQALGPSPAANTQAAGRVLGASPQTARPLAQEAANQPVLSTAQQAQQAATIYQGDPSLGIAASAYGSMPSATTSGSATGYSILGYNPYQAYAQYLESQNFAPWQPGTQQFQAMQQQDVQGFPEWLNTQIQTMGSYGAAKLVSQSVEDVTGKTVPQADIVKMSNEIGQLPTDVQQQIYQLAADAILQPGDASALTSLQTFVEGLPQYQNLLSSMGLSTTPSPQPPPIESAAYLHNANVNSFITSFSAAVGRMPTQNEINQYAQQSTMAQQEYESNLPYQNGVSFGEWQSTYSYLNPLFQEYYGTNVPQSFMAWAAGQPQDVIQQKLMQGPSRVGGMNLGTYLNVGNALDSAIEGIFGNSTADDSLIADFNNATKSFGGTPSFTYNPKGGA